MVPNDLFDQLFSSTSSIVSWKNNFILLVEVSLSDCKHSVVIDVISANHGLRHQTCLNPDPVP